VILDILLPVMDGWAVCKGLRAKSSVPILMLTALGEEVDRILGLETGRGRLPDQTLQHAPN